MWSDTSWASWHCIMCLDSVRMVARAIRSFEISEEVEIICPWNINQVLNYFFMKSIKIPFFKRKSLCNFMRKQLLKYGDSSL